MKQSVSLITPIYNAMPYLETYLNCVLQQTYRPLEFIVVDDGSTDTSLKYIDAIKPEFASRNITFKVLFQEHKGQAAAVNAALPFVRGDFFTWCDGDDYITTDNIEKKVIFLLNHPEIGMVRNDAIVFYENELKQSYAAKEDDCLTKNIFDDLFTGKTYCYAGCYMIRSSLLFECYPSRKIPVSGEGQNLQLLLPCASRSLCGFLPDKSLHYHIRTQGHSSVKRSFTQQMTRLKNFTKLKNEILQYCNCDINYYFEKNKKLFEKGKKELLYSAVCRIREGKNK